VASLHLPHLSFEQVATIYAAVVATFGLGWQVWTWRQGRRPVVVRPALAAVGFDTGTEWVVTIEVVNHREHAVRVTSAGLLLPDGRQWVAIRPFSISTLPGEVKSHDAGKLYVSLSAVEKAIDPRRPVRAWAALATNETLKSKPVRLIAADFPAGSVAEQMREPA
jgi:hypothetical protein